MLCLIENCNQVADVAKAQSTLIDWIWLLYKKVGASFLHLAGPQSDGMVIQRWEEELRGSRLLLHGLNTHETTSMQLEHC